MTRNKKNIHTYNGKADLETFSLLHLQKYTVPIFILIFNSKNSICYYIFSTSYTLRVKGRQKKDVYHWRLKIQNSLYKQYISLTCCICHVFQGIDSKFCMGVFFTNTKNPLNWNFSNFWVEHGDLENGFRQTSSSSRGPWLLPSFY